MLSRERRQEQSTSAGAKEPGGTSTGPCGRLRGGMLIALWVTRTHDRGIEVAQTRKLFRKRCSESAMSYSDASPLPLACHRLRSYAHVSGTGTTFFHSARSLEPLGRLKEDAELARWTPKSQPHRRFVWRLCGVASSRLCLRVIINYLRHSRDIRALQQWDVCVDRQPRLVVV